MGSLMTTKTCCLFLLLHPTVSAIIVHTFKPAATQRAGQPVAALEEIGGGLLPRDEFQQYLRADILRRQQELTALGWLGRAYLLAPAVFGALWPAVFQLEPYSAAAAVSRTSSLPGGRCSVRCILKEASVVARGIPYHLSLETDGGATSELVHAG